MVSNIGVLCQSGGHTYGNPILKMVLVNRWCKKFSHEGPEKCDKISRKRIGRQLVTYIYIMIFISIIIYIRMCVIVCVYSCIFQVCIYIYISVYI